jgi:HEAT repeat protein
MNQRKPRGICATEAGLLKLREAKAQQDENGKPLTYQKIADRAQIDERTVKRFFGGQGVDKESAIAICRALALDITEIVDLSEWNPPNVDWQNVCYQLLEEQPIRRQATNRHGGHEIKIHVPLGLVKPCRQVKREEKCLPDPTEGMQQYKLSETEIEKQFQQDEFLTQVVNKPGKNIAIIGEPGAGKSTWLSKIAEYLMQLENFQAFAICIPLGNLQGMSLETYLRQFWLKTALPKIDPKAVDVCAALEQELVQLFNSGKVWLLLDGADEMRGQDAHVTGNVLQQIANQLTGWIAQARVVLSCRLNVWQANDRSLTNFETYRTLHFENEQVQQFIQGWFAQAEKPELGQNLLTKLAEPEKDRIRDLVKNPLRLSLLCETWDDDQDLPETKALLYQRFRDAFYGWKKDEFPITATQKQGLNQALAQLAFTALERQMSLRESLCEEVMGEAALKLAQEIGWLNFVYRDAQTNEPVYAFFHLTFQEYFAALAVQDWQVFLTHVPNNPKQGIYRIFEPQWKEVILLWLGRLEVPEHQKEAFINALVEFEAGCEDFYEYQAYFLAAAGIGEFKKSSKTEEVVRQIMKLGFGEFNIEEQQWQTFLDPIQEGARAIFPQTHRPTAITVLVKLMDTTKDESTRRWAAESLGKIGTGNPEAITALVELIGSSEDEWTRREAAESLGKIDPGNPEAITALVELIGSSEDELTRYLAAESLGKIDPGNPEAITALVELIGTAKDEDTRRWAAESLGKIDPGNPEAITALVELIGTAKDEDTRSMAAESLGKIDPGNPTAIKALVELIGATENELTRREAAEILGKIGIGNPTAITALVELIGATENELTRRRATYHLGKIGIGNPTAITVLVELIGTTENELTRYLAAESLGKIDPGNPTAIKALVELIGTTKNEDTRFNVVESLGKIDPGNLTAIKALVDLIGTIENEDTRSMAAVSLGKIDPGNPTAITALVDLITCKNELTRRRATYHLGKIDPGNPTAIKALVDLISVTKDKLTRYRAAASLGKIDPGNPTAIKALVDLISITKDKLTRYRAAASLGKIDPGNPTAIKALVDLIGTSKNGYTRREAAESLKKMLVKDDQRARVVSALKNFFSDETYENDFERCHDCYPVIWHCAQNLPYPTFYEAWHHSPGTPHPEVDAVAASPALTLSQLPQLLNAALTSLNLPVETVLCIDGSKFENPDNPAPEIYAELVCHRFPERPNGEPATMQQLKVYCQLKCRNLFLIFYEDPTSPPPQKFSPIFLSSLSKFAQVNRICVVSDQAEIPVQSFSPSNPNLISELVAWIGRMGMEELG